MCRRIVWGGGGKKDTGAEAPAGAKHQCYDLITAISAIIAPMNSVISDIIHLLVSAQERMIKVPALKR